MTTTLAVIGAGSWGSTIAAMLHRNGHDVRLWSHSAAECRRLVETGHPPGVPELTLPKMLVSEDLASVIADTEAAVIVVPAQAVAETCRRIAAINNRPGLYVIASKGIDLTTLRPLSEIVETNIPSARAGVVSGPCIAREVAQGVPTSVVAACADEESAGRIQEWFASPTFRVYRQDDVLGVEYAGAFKNVIAIAAGTCDGLGFGANSKSALLTRGLAEMRRFAMAMGANDLTISGLAGLGDLCVTCFSPFSRNRRFGEALGKGKSTDEAIAEIGETVEGVPTARAVVRIAREKGIETPISAAVEKIIDGVWSPSEAVGKLMGRDLKHEFD